MTNILTRAGWTFFHEIHQGLHKDTKWVFKKSGSRNERKLHNNSMIVEMKLFLCSQQTNAQHAGPCSAPCSPAGAVACINTQCSYVWTYSRHFPLSGRRKNTVKTFSSSSKISVSKSIICTMEVPGPDSDWRGPQFRQKVVAQMWETWVQCWVFFGHCGCCGRLTS